MAERAAKQLELNKSELPNSITEVIATLTRAGFDAYIVGGGVRDTLLGLRPKDFDAVTDAKPHEIKDVFGKRCRIIGRRFQLAHVYSGRELIEVATFRGPPLNDSNTNQDGMILRDNVWGDIKQDFARRDFSINALYYQPLKGVVHDFCGALEDIDNKIIRLLGNAPTRIEEDPVRLLRALRFKAKLGFDFDSELAAQFHDGNWALLEQISPHRLYDETQKMFTGGYLVPLLPLLFESGAIDSLIIYPPAEPSALVKQVAINTDKRIGAGKSINPAFFYAALLWENYLHQLEKAKKRNMPFADAQMHAAGKVIDRQRIKTAIPKFAEQFIRDIWILQPKLAAPRSKQIVQLSEHPRFRAGFDFLLLREQCGDAEHPLSESTNGMGEWWHNYQTLTEEQQQQAIDDFDENIRRGAYKQAQRGRGRNRQKQQTSNDNGKVNHIQNDQQDKVNGNGHSKQVVNDASNVPSRRRRAASQSAQDANNSVSNSSSNDGRNENGRNNSYDKQQATQDNNELAQLQQLSLANIGHQAANKRHNAKPAPLFVIEHEKVVPPLRKQLPSDAQSQSSSKSPSKSKPASQAFVEKNAATDNAAPKEQSGNQAAKHHTKPKQADVNVSTDSASAKAHTTEYATRTVARTPALVSMNNEPIPHKRRRRQPTVVENDNGNSSADSNSVVEAKAVDNKAQKATRYAKKAPKLATEAVSKSETSDVENNAKKATKASAAKPTKTSQDTKSQTSQNQSAKHQTAASKMNEQKGPVPSKRRRRQPSVNNV
ncbi:polynucleotide adenylyltransferase PcnB [Psychrobacter maritimus]|uniref:polynucleotide adenylyltransferase PcnB n=1 Tax=Psychrobacter maritimus TaxID=256325 RepID=UPI00248B03D4|nr:polynucleotide adenylyltransferase PcnB [Psychrobacter sp. WB2]WGV12791.1 polynucleotide adenylyltransferase PcnB [Psychrobacter sp. WB2]